MNECRVYVRGPTPFRRTYASLPHAVRQWGIPMAFVCLTSGSSTTLMATDSDTGAASVPSPSLSLATVLRSSDIEVVITRTLDLLQSGQYADARTEATRVLDLDSTGRARFLMGLACARAKDYPAAVEALEHPHVLQNADSFQQLPIELGLALMAVGRTADARIWLEKARTRPEDQSLAEETLEALDRRGAGGGSLPPVSLFVSLLTGVDNNPGGFPGTAWGECGPVQTGDLNLEHVCGLVMGERLGGRLELTPGAWQLGLEYGFLHRWYPDETLRIFNLQQHDATLRLGHLAGVAVSYGANVQALANTYAPLYAFQQRGELRFRPRTLGSIRFPLRVEFGYRLDVERYADLGPLWGISSATAPTCSAQDGDGLYCTHEQSGIQHNVLTRLQLQTLALRLFLEVEADQRLTESALYHAVGLTSRSRGTFAWSPYRQLTFSLQARWHRLPEWDVTQLQAGVGIRQALAERWALQLSYSAGLSTTSYPDDPTLEQGQRRQQGLLEVSYAQ